MSTADPSLCKRLRENDSSWYFSYILRLYGKGQRQIPTHSTLFVTKQGLSVDSKHCYRFMFFHGCCSKAKDKRFVNDAGTLCCEDKRAIFTSFQVQCNSSSQSNSYVNKLICFFSRNFNTKAINVKLSTLVRKVLKVQVLDLCMLRPMTMAASVSSCFNLDSIPLFARVFPTQRPDNNSKWGGLRVLIPDNTKWNDKTSEIRQISTIWIFKYKTWSFRYNLPRELCTFHIEKKWKYLNQFLSF